MPKRKNRDSDVYILRKIKKLERKLRKRSQKKSTSDSSDNSDTSLSLQKDKQPEQSVDLTGFYGSIDDELNTIELSPTDRQESDPSLQIVEPEQQNPEIYPISANEPSTSAAPSEPTIVLDENILEMLGETPSKNKNYSAPIQSELAVRLEHITTTGLSKDIKKDLLGKYFLPENCLRIGAPKLNPEIKAALSDTLVKKDTVIEIKQNQRAIAISCIGHALTKIFASQNKDTEVVKYLIDASRLLCDSQYTESMSRRSFVTSTIKKDIKDHLFSTDIDSHLFGEKLSDTLRAAKAINKSGAEMKTVLPPKSAGLPQTSFHQSRTLNTRPPFPMARQAGAGRRPTAATQPPRRYQPPPPPPPPPTLPHMTYRPSLPAQSQRSRGRGQTRR